VRDLVVLLVRGLVREPQKVRVHEHEYEGSSVFEVQVAGPDRGRVIGRQGRTADALRTLCEALAERRGRSCEVEILD
jgi:predicted RNA-binding protein YlqC (UPF0109 family)